MRRTTLLRAAVLTAAAATIATTGGAVATVSAATASTSSSAAACAGSPKSGTSAARVRDNAATGVAEPKLYPDNEANAYGVIKPSPMMKAGSVTIPTVFHVVSDHVLSAAERDRQQRMIRPRCRSSTTRMPAGRRRTLRTRRSGSASARSRGR